MGGRKKYKIPFDNRGGTVITPRRLYDSRNYLTLTARAKALMPLLHIHWRNDKYVDYGIREASEKIPCDRRTATKAFNTLEARGFITMIEYALFNSRTGSKSRTWRLEWMPSNDQLPTNKWEGWISN
jgi:hypothetical protein